MLYRNIESRLPRARALPIVSCALLGFLILAAGCGAKSPAVLKVEQGLDALVAGVEMSGGDCKKMAAAVQAPAETIVSGLLELKKNREKLPATTKMKFAGLASSLQKMQPCSGTPEMQQVIQKLTKAVGGG